MPSRTSPALVAALVAASALELLVLALVVHRLVGQPMRARGLPRWAPSDTLLTAPLFFAGAALFLGGTNGAIVTLAHQASAAVPSTGSSPAPWLASALAGLVLAAFGVRAFGKLY